MIDKPSRLQPALLGGLVIGLGSVIPGLSYANLCCCGWGIVGGALAAWLLIRKSPVLPVSKGSGASTGALAGIVGAGVYLVIGVPLLLLQWSTVVSQMEQRGGTIDDPVTRETFNKIVGTMQSHPWAIALVMWLLFGVIATGVASLGGVIGTAMFEKRKGEPMPPGSGYTTGYGTPQPPAL